MLNMSYGNNLKNTMLLGKKYCREDIGNIEKNVYSNSENLSNHISNNILESLREQLSRQGLQVNVESEKELETTD